MLTRIHQIAIEVVEILRLLAQGVGQAITRGNILLDVIDHLAHVGIVEALANDVEGLQQGHTRAHHGRQLSGKQRDIHGLDLLALTKQRHRLLAHPGRVDPLLAQLRLDQRRIQTRHLALHLGPFAIGPLPGEAAHLDSFIGHGLDSSKTRPGLAGPSKECSVQSRLPL